MSFIFSSEIRFNITLLCILHYYALANYKILIELIKSHGIQFCENIIFIIIIIIELNKFNHLFNLGNVVE